MQQRKLGSSGLIASQMGLGCMGMSEFYGPHEDKESLAVIDRALELGINFLDTADAYGPYTNEMLVGKAIKGRRDKFVVATKFGFVRNLADSQWRGMSGKPDYVQFACEESLRRLNIETIDLYYLHRVDPETPIEETVTAMATLVQQGKCVHLDYLKLVLQRLKGHRRFIRSRLYKQNILYGAVIRKEKYYNYCRESGVAFVAYSPLGRGFLTGQINKPEDLAADDWRRNAPRFQGENFDTNLALVEKVKVIAKEKGCTPAQLALAWVMAQGDHIFPIPGTKKVTYLEENAVAAAIHFTEKELTAISDLFPADIVAGQRYTEGGMKIVNA